MCESCFEPLTRWKGWRPLPEPRICQPAGSWVDLSHCLTERLPRIAPLPQPTFQRLAPLPANPARITDIHMVSHVGTHVDAPCHFVADGPSAEQIPLERLHGPGVVWRVEVGPFSEIDVEHLQRATPAVQPGDIVVLSTGWAKRMGTPSYEDHPFLSTAAAEWLVEKAVKLVAVDFSTPDLTVHKRPSGFTWPVHQILLAHGVLIAEHVNNLDALEGQTAELMFLGLNIGGSDGLPTRAIGRAISR